LIWGMFAITAKVSLTTAFLQPSSHDSQRILPGACSARFRNAALHVYSMQRDRKQTRMAAAPIFRCTLTREVKKRY
jgi:hypothetical protein